MRFTEEQLDTYIALYRETYGEELERTRALEQLNKLISLVLYMAYPETTVKALEDVLETEYTDTAAHKASVPNNTAISTEDWHTNQKTKKEVVHN